MSGDIDRLAVTWRRLQASRDALRRRVAAAVLEDLAALRGERLRVDRERLDVEQAERAISEVLGGDYEGN